MRLTYSELINISDYKERFRYLAQNSFVGDITFGGKRSLNQSFYRSKDWKKFRDKIILRDNGMDMAMDGYSIQGRIIIHHLNPLTVKDFETLSYDLFDPENVVCVSESTHNAIHYGDETSIMMDVTDRKPNDTCPWKKE